MGYYKLDPSHYLSSPALSRDATLKATGIKLQLISDIDVYHFLEIGIRSGISYIFQRYGKANNVCMKSYNKPSNHLIYEDRKNLFGYKISKFLPEGKFKLCFKGKNFRRKNFIIT